jgi:hypothetical protein
MTLHPTTWLSKLRPVTQPEKSYELNDDEPTVGAAAISLKAVVLKSSIF